MKHLTLGAHLMFRRLRPLFCLIVTAVTLSGCYLPARFDSEIELDRRGYYKVMFSGYVVDTRLYGELKNGKMSSAEEVEEVKKLKTAIWNARRAEKSLIKGAITRILERTGILNTKYLLAPTGNMSHVTAMKR